MNDRERLERLNELNQKAISLLGENGEKIVEEDDKKETTIEEQEEDFDSTSEEDDDEEFEEEGISEEKFEEELRYVLDELNIEGVGVRSAQSFEESGVLTRDRGVRVKMDNGNIFYLTIQRQDR